MTLIKKSQWYETTDLRHLLPNLVIFDKSGVTGRVKKR
jgi:hypothetical protein